MGQHIRFVRRGTSRGGISGSYLRHNRSTILTLDISKGHLGAFVLVDLEFWMVEIWDLVDGDCGMSERNVLGDFLQAHNTYFYLGPRFALREQQCQSSFELAPSGGPGTPSFAAPRYDLR